MGAQGYLYVIISIVVISSIMSAIVSISVSASFN